VERDTGLLVSRRQLLVLLYGVGVVLSNSLFAFGLFYVVFGIWVAFAAYSRQALRPSERWITRVLWTFIATWILAVLPLMLFAVLPGIILWYAGTVGTVGSASYLLSRALRPSAPTARDRFRRYGLAAGIATALLFLAPGFTGIFGVVAGQTDFWLAYLPVLVGLVPAAVGIVCFARVSGGTAGA